MKQARLDEYMEDGFKNMEKVVEDRENYDEEKKNYDEGCIYCRSFNGVYTAMGKKLKLHPGSLFLFIEDGVGVYADIDHVFHRCREGLIQNIRFLYSMFKHFSGMDLKVVAVGKAFDDSLYLYVSNILRLHQGRAVYRDFTVSVIDNTSLEEFKRRHYYMQIVDKDIVEEALGGG